MATRVNVLIFSLSSVASAGLFADYFSLTIVPLIALGIHLFSPAMGTTDVEIQVSSAGDTKVSKVLFDAFGRLMQYAS